MSKLSLVRACSICQKPYRARGSGGNLCQRCEDEFEALTACTHSAPAGRLTTLITIGLILSIMVVFWYLVLTNGAFK